MPAPPSSPSPAAPKPCPEWIIAYAGGPSDGAVWPTLALPHLQELLAYLQQNASWSGDDMDLTPPHERALARSLGLDDRPGLTPWAAWQAQDHQQACAFISPGHWRIGADQVFQTDPQAHPMTEAQSRQLLALLAPWFAEDGMTLEYELPWRWLARGPIFEQLATASLERVLGRDVRPWLPDPAQARTLLRLQSEVQMLLYTHGFNDERAALGLPPINAFWVHGAGRLAHAPAAAAADHITCINTLRNPSLLGDAQAWGQAWQAMDAELMAQLLARARSGQAMRLTLCGERHAMQWQNQPRGWGAKIRSLWASKRLPDLHKIL